MLAVIVGLLACIFGATVAAPTPDECPRIMHGAGLSPMFAPMITHSIHSLTLEDIRYYFKSDATEDNGIPTVNMDLEGDKRVLPNAPLAGYDEDFSTMGMKSFDLVMRNMNRTWWGVAGYNVLEKIAHALHMSEAWSNAVEQYKRIGKLVDPDSDTCACVTDIENNGVLDHLHLIAFKIRYPGITSGNGTITKYYLAEANLKESRSKDSPVAVRQKREIVAGVDFDGLSVEAGAKYVDEETGLGVGVKGRAGLNKDGAAIEGEVSGEFLGVEATYGGGVRVEQTAKGVEIKASPFKVKVEGIVDTGVEARLNIDSDGTGSGSLEGKLEVFDSEVKAGGHVEVDGDSITGRFKGSVDLPFYSASYDAKLFEISTGNDDDDSDDGGSDWDDDDDDWDDADGGSDWDDGGYDWDDDDDDWDDADGGSDWDDGGYDWDDGGSDWDDGGYDWDDGGSDWDDGGSDWDGWWYRSHESERFDGINFSLSDFELLKDVAEKLVDGDVATIDHLDSAEHWKYWKDMLKMPKQDSAYYDLAMFMFCTLN